MAIGKGQDWGYDGYLPDDAPVALSDAEAASLVGGPHGVIGVAAGDLARTLGIKVPYDRTTPKHLVPIDAIQIELDDGSSHTCLAHAVLGNLVAHQHSAALMNAAFIGRRNIAPRAHPGDGKVDVVTLGLRLGDRIKAWQRMVTGTHVPHPDIDVVRSAAGRVELPQRHKVRIDGQLCGRSRTMTFQVIPEAIVVAVS